MGAWNVCSYRRKAIEKRVLTLILKNPIILTAWPLPNTFVLPVPFVFDLLLLTMLRQSLHLSINSIVGDNVYCLGSGSTVLRCKQKVYAVKQQQFLYGAIWIKTFRRSDINSRISIGIKLVTLQGSPWIINPLPIETTFALCSFFI